MHPILQTAYRILIAPHNELRDVDSRRSAILLAFILSSMISVFTVYDIIHTIFEAGYHPPYYGYLFLFTSYFLARSRYFIGAASLTVIMFPVVVMGILLTGKQADPTSALYYLPLGVIVAALFFPFRIVAGVAVFQVLLIHAVPLFGIPGADSLTQISGQIVSTILTSVLVLLLIYHRSSIEKQRQSDLETSTSRLEIALTAGLTATWDWDIAGGRIMWSEAARQIFGAEGVGPGSTFEEFLDRVHPEDREFVRSTSSNLRDNKDALKPSEFRVVRPNGEVRWISSIGRVMTNAIGQPVRLLGMISDITDRKEANRALERQVMELRALSSVGFVCNEALTLDELISRVTDIVGKTLYPDNFGFLLLNKPTGELEHHPSFRKSPGASIKNISLSEGTSGWVARHRKPRRLNDTTTDPSYVSLADDMRSEICVPIVAGEDLIGVINAESARSSAFTEDDERLLMTLASEIAVACKRLKAESELRESRELLARSQALAHLGSWEWDLASNKTVWSAELAKIFGEEQTGPTTFNIERIHPEDRSMVESTLRGAMETGIIPQIEIRIIRQDGRTRVLLGQGSVIKDPKGIPMRVVGTALDITEIRHAEDRFSKAFRSIHDAMAILKIPSAEFVEVNEGFMRMSGYSRQEAIGKTPMQLEMWADREDERRFRAALSGTSGVKNFDVEFIDKDKKVHSCLLSAERIEIDGEPHAVTITRDISDRKVLEEQLLQSQKLESIGRLAGGIAHDFNNYLSAILGYADIAEKKATDDRMKTYLRNIKSASEKASHLTRQLLAFARKQIIAPKVVTLNAVIEDADKMLRRLIGEDVELAIRPGQNVPRVKIDPNQFDQVLINLVVNARDSLARGGRITIATSQVTLELGHPWRGPRMDATSYASMTVTDTGHGIPEDVREHIFEPFFTTKEQGKGTGLGLPTCLGIMEQNGGTIILESSTKKGTSFRILVPAYEGFEEQEAAVVEDATPRGTETILFAEDEYMVREIGVETLRELGYKVYPAANGPEALLFATTFKGTIDILVTDVIMPQMSGKELADHVRKIRPQTKLLYTSGYTESIISEHGVLESGISLLQKPYSPRTLAKRVRDILDGIQSEDL